MIRRKQIKMNAKDVSTGNKSIIKACLGPVTFVVIFVILLTMITYMMRPSGDTKNRFMGFYAEPRNSLDVIMIGSSPTYSSCVMPELYGEYGIKAYPLASNVQRPMAGKYLVREADKTQSPQLYMFEMRMYTGTEESLTINMGYTREVTDNMKYSFNRIACINAMVHRDVNSEDGKKYTYYFDIFKYHSNWISLINLDQVTSLTYVKKDPYKGYKITDKVGPVDTPSIMTDPAPAELDPYQAKALYDLLDELDRQEADALFYLAPYDMPPEDAGKFETIKNIVESRGYDWLDMNHHYDEIGMDFSRDFSDYGIHTNAIGARKCTIFLGEYLRDHYDLPDHLADDAADESWDAAYANWQDEYEKAVVEIDRRIEAGDFFEIEE